MEVHIGWIVLHCIIEHDEIDKYSYTSGHYTEIGDPYIEMIVHNGQDISEIVDEDTKDIILDQYEKETSNEDF